MLREPSTDAKREHAGWWPHSRDHSRLESAGGGTLMAIHSEHLETLEAVIATALNIVKNRTSYKRKLVTA
jgi:hypothetical protein